jgi:hypothetical protein
MQPFIPMAKYRWLHEAAIQSRGRLCLRPDRRDPAPSPPDNLAVTVMQGDRIFIFTEKATVKGMPACSVSNQQTSITYEQCFAKKLPSQSEYPKLVNQAQRLVDLVSPQLQR